MTWCGGEERGAQFIKLLQMSECVIRHPMTNDDSLCPVINGIINGKFLREKKNPHDTVS